ncbi:MAG TPA: hypothetical protein VFZ05_04020 [Nitrososphaera sp.]
MQILESKDQKSGNIADILCNQCKERPAEIFQVTGDYCIECWQALTHTNA